MPTINHSANMPGGHFAREMSARFGFASACQHAASRLVSISARYALRASLSGSRLGAPPPASNPAAAGSVS
jgi:hypothetical protein